MISKDRTFRLGNILMVCIVLFVSCFIVENIGKMGKNVFAYDETVELDGDTDLRYQVFDENGNLLLERSAVVVGDEFILSGKYKYEIYEVASGVAYARFVGEIVLPKVNLGELGQINNNSKAIGLYMTHNDESYVTGDGVDSIYGAGGIHDIAKAIRSSFESMGISVYLCEDLHIPHDTSAYTRSKVTATNLLNDHSLNALFDIHRDGASRSTYVTKYNGIDRCKVRIVVGKANANYKVQEEFAMYLLSVAEQLYPWLFLDVYYASGHYNQNLYSKALLFEMGSHLVEKSLVLKTVPALAEVVNTALFYTTIDENDNSITIGGDLSQGNTVDEVLENYNISSETGGVMIVTISGVIIIFTVSVALALKMKKANRKKK